MSDFLFSIVRLKQITVHKSIPPSKKVAKQAFRKMDYTDVDLLGYIPTVLSCNWLSLNHISQTGMSS